MCGLLGQIFEALFRNEEERAFYRRVADRECLTDAEFADRFFPHHVNRNIPIAVARVVKRQLMLPNIRPEDNLATTFPDLDTTELFADLFEELKFRDNSFPYEELDGTVGNLVEVVTARWQKHEAAQYASKRGERFT
jgi:hypothetical protein